MYEIYADDFDSESFNRTAERTLDNVLEKLEEQNLDKVKKVYNEISKKFRLDRWHDFPVDPKKSFYIRKVDLETGKLDVNLRGVGINSYRTLMELEDFYNLIYNYSLF